MTKRKKGKEIKFTLPRMPKIGRGFVVGVLAVALLVGVVPVKADGGSVWDVIGRVAGELLGNKLADQVAEQEIILSGASGPDKYNQQHFLDSYTSGGSPANASTTLTSALTLTTKQVCENSYIHVNSAAVAGTLSAASLDITFPATSTLFASCLNYPGAEKVITFRNNSPTAATTTELVAGTGCDMRLSENTGADNDIDGLNEARITIRRTDDAFADGGSVDCIILVEETVVD